MKDLQKGWEAVKREAEDIGAELGLREPTLLEQAQRGANIFLKGAREEFGAPNGVIETFEEFAASATESLGIKEPRVGKSLVEVIKSAFDLLAAATGTEKEQNTASKKFEKACKTFSIAMTALFKTKEKGSHKDTKATEVTQKPNADRQKKREAKKAAIVKRQTDRKAVNPNTNTGRGGR